MFFFTENKKLNIFVLFLLSATVFFYLSTGLLNLFAYGLSENSTIYYTYKEAQEHVRTSPILMSVIIVGSVATAIMIFGSLYIYIEENEFIKKHKEYNSRLEVKDRGFPTFQFFMGSIIATDPKTGEYVTSIYPDAPAYDSLKLFLLRTDFAVWTADGKFKSFCCIWKLPEKGIGMIVEVPDV